MPNSRHPDAAVARLVAETRFIFTGTVEREASSSLSFIPAGTATAVVRVDRIHHASPALHSQAGQEVTLVCAESSVASSAKGRRLFFTNPILYGETIAVREIGNMEVPDDQDAFHDWIVRMTGDAKEEELREHLASAEVVLHGHVMTLRPVSEVPVVLASEHDPDWAVAVIRVKSSLKGVAKGPISVRFPKSRDVRWYGTPKLKEGDEGVLILHRDGLELGDATLAVLHANDFLPGGTEVARRIKELMRPRRSRE
jgi:hypothetical protein